MAEVLQHLSSDSGTSGEESDIDGNCERLEACDDFRNNGSSVSDEFEDQSSGVPTSSETSSRASSSVSILSVLKAPTASDLSRKRVVARNPPRGKRKCRGTSIHDPRSINPSQRVKEYPSEPLCVSNGKLFCRGCREEICIKKSSLKNHLRSSKHIKGKEMLKLKKKQEQDIAKSLKQYNNETHLRGETLPESQQVFRVKVMKTFLKAGVPLNKIGMFRELLEENGYRLSDRRFMYDLIPFILKEEEERIKKELKEKFVGIIFDGTTHVCEALAIVFRFVGDSWTIEQRLIRVQLLAKSLTGEEIARELISVISTTFSIGSSSLIAAMRDRASVNNVAIRTLKIVYPNLLDVGCFAHTLDLVGNHFKIPNLLEFVNCWLMLFSHSVKSKFVWKEQTGKAMASFSNTRWWSKWEVINQLLLQFADIQPFLLKNPDIGPSTRPKLLDFFRDPQKLKYLKLELAAVVDYGEMFVKATYNLEGDGPLAFTCYDVIQEVISAIQVANTPNLRAIVNDLSTNKAVQQQAIAYAKSCIEPALEYFQHQLANSLKCPLAAFKASRLFNPHKVKLLKPDASSVDTLLSFPFFNENEIMLLKQELPTYLSKVLDVDDSIDSLEWWKVSETSLPAWAAAAKKVLVVQPTSASVERVFSLLNLNFGDQQQSSLQDYIEASLMLRYNCCND